MIALFDWFQCTPFQWFVIKIQVSVAVFVLLAWVLEQTRFRHYPAGRCFLWEATLFCALLSPLAVWFGPHLPFLDCLPFHSQWDSSPGFAALPTDWDSQDLTLGRTEGESHYVVDPLSSFPQTNPGSPATGDSHSNTNGPQASGVEPLRLAIPADFWLLVFSVWIAGTCWFSIRLAHGLIWIRRLLRDDCEPIGDGEALLVARVAERLGLGKPPPIRFSSKIRGPFVFGVFQPIVMLPSQLKDKENQDRLFDVLVHEFAHIFRQDGKIQAMQQLAFVLFWFHPLIWLLNRNLDRAREEVCDNFVLKHTEPAVYAGHLLALAETFFPFPSQMGLLAILGKARGLERRIEDLLDDRRDRSTQVHKRSKAFLALLLALTAGFAGALGVRGGGPMVGGLGLWPGGASQETPLVLGGSPAVKPPSPSLADEVKRSIARGVEYLRQQEKGSGHWEVNEESAARTGGWSALAMLALLSSEVPVDDPMIQRGLAYLRKIPAEQTYPVSLQTMVFVLAGQPEDRPLIQRNVDWLLKTRIPGRNEGRNGGWGYGSGQGSPDNSNTQYAIMALTDAIQAGAKVPREVLQTIANDVTKSQQADGGWSYRTEPFTTFTMTQGGTASQANLYRLLAGARTNLAEDGSVYQCGKQPEWQSIQRGLGWVEDQMPKKLESAEAANRAFRHPFYAMHGTQRMAKATGQRFLGGTDWYKIEVEFLLKHQNETGFWSFKTISLDDWPVVATSFALIFLSQGKTPVLIAKLSDLKAGWGTTKFQDLRHLVHFASKEAFGGARLSWQVFETSRLPLEENKTVQEVARQMLDTPVLWLSGHDQVPDGPQRALLKAYLDQGGLLFAEACCAKEEFDRNFRAMMRALYPNHLLQPVTAQHPLWKTKLPWGGNPQTFPLWSLEVEGRTIAIYCPKPLAGYWEGNPGSSDRAREAFQLGTRVLAFAQGAKPFQPRLSWVPVENR